MASFLIQVSLFTVLTKEGTGHIRYDKAGPSDIPGIESCIRIGYVSFTANGTVVKFRSWISTTCFLELNFERIADVEGNACVNVMTIGQVMTANRHFTVSIRGEIRECEDC